MGDWGSASLIPVVFIHSYIILGKEVFGSLYTHTHTHNLSGKDITIIVKMFWLEWFYPSK